MNEYADQFTKLERFAPGLCMTETDRIKRFKRGLHDFLAPHIYPHSFTRLYEAIDKACGLDMITPESKHKDGNDGGRQIVEEAVLAGLDC